MLVTIYAVTTQHSTSWYYTICPPVDRIYWADIPRALFALEPPIPLCYARQWLDENQSLPIDTLPALTYSIQQFAEQSNWPSSLIRNLRFVSGLALHAFQKDDQRQLQLDESQWLKMCMLLQGRSLLITELQQLLQHHNLHHVAENWPRYIQQAILCDRVRLSPGVQLFRQTSRKWLVFKQNKRILQCSRCGADAQHLHRTTCETCGYECSYCNRCLQMGRCKQCSLVICGVKSDTFKPIARTVTKTNERTSLTVFQKKAADAAIHFLREQTHHTFLLWAVTGAGKTEMMFPILEEQVQSGRKLALVTPRRDVVLELLPRIVQAFPESRVIALYGSSQQTWQDAEIIIATTHQMLRFFAAFDTVIIDEMDAFPYHNNPMLSYAVQKSLRQQGQSIWLTATPPADSIRLIRQGRIPHAVVPQRFHGHPLPVPVHCQMAPLYEQLHRNQLSRNVWRSIRSSLQRGAQLFVFIPKIRLVQPVVELLQHAVTSDNDKTCESIIKGTSSQDEQRSLKVQAFRDGQINILVTTTILERGVTVACADVLVLDADNSLFDRTSLIQMAGRAGRSSQDPNGNVWFCSHHWTTEQRAATKQIKRFNDFSFGKVRNI